MKKTTCILLTAFTVLLLMILVLPRLEGFGTSPGTLVQLSTSHVPTEEDEYYLRYIYPRMVNRDLIDMTGSGLF
jgi:hypothetical protein